MMNEKMDILMMMVENGYHLMNRTMEEMAEIFTVDELYAMARKFLGEEEE